MLDRIDMQVLVGQIPAAQLSTAATGEDSATIAARVATAFERQLQRQGKPNSLLGTREIDQHCRPDEAGEALLQRAMERLDWSARAYHRVLKLARTIADMGDAPRVERVHVAEAIQYRRALRER
ncbi:hypothetical protein [Herbaspirillum sp. alder98]|uniref:magnesium chelatase subunit ChlI family protein n=1 Tax=Herbaspirillum sp. alder98 TaxID=2913096 RepID=UPI002A5AEB86|nr:hypothetical protein [Herbaspirillum sp. alder98]